VISQELIPPVDLPVRARRHDWDIDNVKRRAAIDAKDGKGRTERTCKLCKMVKVTIHYARGFPGREWRTADGKIWRGQATPPCLDRVTG
jgi:hypothetical protein